MDSKDCYRKLFRDEDLPFIFRRRFPEGCPTRCIGYENCAWYHPSGSLKKWLYVIINDEFQRDGED